MSERTNTYSKTIVNICFAYVREWSLLNRIVFVPRSSFHHYSLPPLFSWLIMAVRFVRTNWKCCAALNVFLDVEAHVSFGFDIRSCRAQICVQCSNDAVPREYLSLTVTLFHLMFPHFLFLSSHWRMKTSQIYVLIVTFNLQYLDREKKLSTNGWLRTAGRAFEWH